MKYLITIISMLMFVTVPASAHNNTLEGDDPEVAVPKKSETVTTERATAAETVKMNETAKTEETASVSPVVAPYKVEEPGQVKSGQVKSEDKKTELTSTTKDTMDPTRTLSSEGPQDGGLPPLMSQTPSTSGSTTVGGDGVTQQEIAPTQIGSLDLGIGCETSSNPDGTTTFKGDSGRSAPATKASEAELQAALPDALHLETGRTLQSYIPGTTFEGWKLPEGSQGVISFLGAKKLGYYAGVGEGVRSLLRQGRDAAIGLVLVMRTSDGGCAVVGGGGEMGGGAKTETGQTVAAPAAAGK